MQFGSVFKMKPKPGKKAELIGMMAEEPDRKINGFIMAHAVDAGDEVWAIAVFADEATYRANASGPAQDAEYQKMRALLESDPEWHDGTITTVNG